MTAIKFENISKQYRLGLVSTRTLSHDLNRWWAMNILGKEDPYLKVGEVNDRAHKGDSEYVWALKDINFEIEQGDVLGIIGKNGAGKSTLLKILSKVTAPTTGIIKARGRIASLLEVGTGFHPEMTGRENIYMNGSIMGMTKAEITRKLDEIVDFSGVERYLDTPVKRYSSGMTVRLGFAIAAHLEPEILVVDEVLAVGDAEFQKKAIGKMQDVSKGDGRTVLFVSHNMMSVRKLCNKGIVLQNGQVIFRGGVDDSIEYYIGSGNINIPVRFYDNILTAPGNGFVKLKSFKVSPLIGNEINMSSGLQFDLYFYNFTENNKLGVTYQIRRIDDVVILHQGVQLAPNSDCKKGYYNVSFSLPANYLNAGRYRLEIIFGQSGHILWRESELIIFEILPTVDGLEKNMSINPGIIVSKIDFSHTFLGEVI